MPFPFAMWKSGAAVYDPAVLSLTGWWRASFASSPWAAVASAGSSGSNGSLTEATNPPAVGTSVNSLDPADFDGTNDQLSNATTVATFLSDAAGSIAVLFYADAAASDVGSTAYYGYPQLFGDDTNAFIAFTFTDAGLTLGSYNGSDFNGPVVACGTGGWHLGQARWNSTDMEVRVDGGSWTTLSRVITMSGTDGVLVGPNSALDAFFDGRILEVMTAQSRLSDTNFDNIKSYCNSRYALSL